MRDPSSSHFTRLLALLLCAACPESPEEAYQRGRAELLKEQHEQITCKDGEAYPSHWSDEKTHVCVHGYWIAVAAERRADLPVPVCVPPYCLEFP
jgi:hypothetical protein